MRAITIHQPWAWSVMHGKDVENRPRGASYRGPLLIHAGARWSERDERDPNVLTTWKADQERTQEREYAETGVWPVPRPLGPAFLPRMAIVAACELVDAHPDIGCCRPWGISQYNGRGELWHYVIESVMPLPEPVPCRGQLGLWKPPVDVVAAIEDQLARVTS